MCEITFLLLISLGSIYLLDLQKELRRVGGNFLPSQQPKSFEHNVPVESIANTRIFVRVSKQREGTGRLKESSGHGKRVNVGNWFSIPGSMSYKLLPSGMVPPGLSIHLWLSLTHWTPVLERGSIFFALCSFLVQCLLWSGVKEFSPWLLVLKMVQGWGG